MDDLVSRSLARAPALLLMWSTIYAAYWVVGIAKYPRLKWRERLADKWGTVTIESLGGFSLRSLALISTITLFLELLLIRWIASEIRIFAYFKSLILIACFLGFGLGCYLTRKPIRLYHMLAPLLALVFIVELPWPSFQFLIESLCRYIGWMSDLHLWARSFLETDSVRGLLGVGVAMSVVIPIFGLVAITFVPLGQLVGWYLEKAPKGITAYSVNVSASIAGIWLYAAVCFLSTPPVTWFVLAGAGLLFYFRASRRPTVSLAAAFAVMIAMFGLGTLKTQWWGEASWRGATPAVQQLKPAAGKTYWSPYQKLTLVPLKSGDEVVRYVLNTNDTWFQQIIDLSDEGVSAHPELYAGLPIELHQYNLPYQFYENPGSVLIAGAGMGNDVAAALRHGAKHVTAVEIDPLIYERGKEMHFERPYDSERVEVHIDDARSFIQNTKEKFDFVMYSILDSHTTSSHYTNIRLDNYVYTLESMQRTRELLKPDGVFVMSFSSERPWFTQRLRELVTKAFGKEPLMMQSGISFFVISPGTRVEEALKKNIALRAFVDLSKDMKFEAAAETTDDWPYLYLRDRGIPNVIWWLSIGLIGMFWLVFRQMREGKARLEWHFFFLGAAFMLLEVQIISKCALLFGTTWMVNGIVITTLLAFILLSNVIFARFPRFPQNLAYVGLMATLILSYLTPANTLFHDSILMRGIAATALYCSPVFFAGLIFISSFQRVGFRAEALGSNLFGALVGGLLESLSYAIGIQALVLVAALLYMLSGIMLLRGRGKAGVALDVGKGA